MKKLSIFLVAIFAVFAVGCGGSGGGSPEAEEVTYSTWPSGSETWATYGFEPTDPTGGGDITGKKNSAESSVQLAWDQGFTEADYDAYIDDLRVKLGGVGIDSINLMATGPELLEESAILSSSRAIYPFQAEGHYFKYSYNGKTFVVELMRAKVRFSYRGYHFNPGDGMLIIIPWSDNEDLSIIDTGWPNCDIWTMHYGFCPTAPNIDGRNVLAVDSAPKEMAVFWDDFNEDFENSANVWRQNLTDAGFQYLDMEVTCATASDEAKHILCANPPLAKAYALMYRYNGRRLVVEIVLSTIGGYKFDDGINYEENDGRFVIQDAPLGWVIP